MHTEGTSGNATLRLDTSASSLIDKKPKHFLLESSVTPKRASLTGLRERLKFEEVRITPELAARTVREYLLPMFEADSRAQSARTRKGLFGLDGTSVYTELKLSEQLSVQLADMQQVLRGKEQLLREALQERASVHGQYEALQHEHLKTLTDLTLLREQSRGEELSEQQTELRFSLLGTQLSQYQLLYVQLEADKKQLSSLLHEEKAISDKLRNKAIELESGNSLLRMENDIIGERLKGLYKSILQIADIHELQEKVKPEVEALATSGVLLAQFQAQVQDTLAGALSERDQLREDCAEITKQRQETRESRELLAVASRDKITLLQEGLEKAHEEISTLKVEQDKCDKLVKTMEDEITKMRTKLKQNRLKRRQYGETEEKICKKCQHVYMDSENFNWSCRTHKGEYSDEMWWCCGKTMKDAPGCLVSKHESKEEEEEQDNLQVKEETERQKVASMQCPVTYT